MKIETRKFGEMEIDLGQVVTFRQPMYGFEQEKEYVLLSDSDVGDCFLWLQSITSRETCFVLIDPAVLSYKYDPKLPDDAVKQLELDDPNDAVIRLVAVVPEDFAKSTVNLRSPIVINTVRHTASQVMLEQDYPISAPLIDRGAGEL